MRLVMKLYIIFTTCVRSTMGRCVSVNRGRGKGYPWPLVPGHFLGGRGYSQFLSLVMSKVLSQVLLGRGGGGYPSHVLCRGTQAPPPSQYQDKVTSLSLTRTRTRTGVPSPLPLARTRTGVPPHSTRRGQDRSRVVRLLRSHRRTFLFYTISLQNCHVLPQSLNQQI